MGRGLFQNRTRTDGTRRRGLLVARLAAVERVEIHPGLSNTFWLNHTFFNHAERQNPGLRPFIYHRWGGLGSHRYPLAFSGDTYATWPMLAYLPYFTATASNVNYGWWGHDIGGHMFHKTQKATDPELYTRWLQYGVFTPIFKTHSTKDPRIERCIWCFPDHMFLMRDAIRLRYTLAPYIYNAARENYDTGVGMCPPDVLRLSRIGQGVRDARTVHVRQRHSRHDHHPAGGQHNGSGPPHDLVPRRGVVRLRDRLDVRRRPHRGAALHAGGKSPLRQGRLDHSDESGDCKEPPAAVRYAGADLHSGGDGSCATTRTTA